MALSAIRTFRLDPVDGLLVVAYEFENVDAVDSIVDLRVTQYVDYDMGEFSNTDRGRYRVDSSRGQAYVEQTELPGFGDEEDLYAGFGATETPVGRELGNRVRVLNSVFSADRLANNDGHDGDVGLALEYSLGSLAPGETATLKTAFAAAPSPQILKALLLKPRLPLGPGDLADAIRTFLLSGDATGPDGGERIVFDGTLAQFLALATTGNGVPLAPRPAAASTVGGPGGETRGCFTPAPAVHDLVFRWSLPRELTNELQGDSVSFDLGFYAEQCRHNDGRGRP